MLNLLKKIIPHSLHPLEYFNERVLRYTNGVIHKGPFKGMKYIDEAFVGFVCHKVTGTYEKEIQDVIQDELNNFYDAVIDIGSAEGYYAVGMAKFSKTNKVISFEGSKQGRNLQRKLASLNNVTSKLEIYKYCKKEQLLEQIQRYKNVFIICDVDGYELALLDNNFIPQLNLATMLIECHNHCYAEMEKCLIERFSDTHKYQSYSVRQTADYKDYPCPNFYYNILPKKYKDFPIRETERADEDTWLYLKPRTNIS